MKLLFCFFLVLCIFNVMISLKNIKIVNTNSKVESNKLSDKSVPQELESEDKFDSQGNLNDSNEDEDDVDLNALQKEIHQDVGSEKVSYEFDD